jgi:hypothetical protein
MRRVVTKGLLLAAVPVGVGVGLWMALLTYVPYCPVKGLGTANLCAARPSFDPRLCVLCGAAGAALTLLVSIAVSRRASKVGIFDLGAAAIGIALGLWTSLMVYTQGPCGPNQLCIIVIAHRFATWQSALIGAAATAGILVVGSAVDTDFRRVNFRAARTVQRWLFNDLSDTAPIARSSSDAG